LALAAVVLSTVVGCTGAVGAGARSSASAPAPATVTQTGVSNGLAGVASVYALAAIDGHALPYARVYTKDPAASVTQVVSGTLDLKPDGTFSMSTKYRAVEAQGERLFDGQFNGACAPDGDGYRLYWNGGGETALSVSGDTAIVNNDGILFRYLRRR